MGAVELPPAPPAAEVAEAESDVAEEAAAGEADVAAADAEDDAAVSGAVGKAVAGTEESAIFRRPEKRMKFAFSVARRRCALTVARHC